MKATVLYYSHKGKTAAYAREIAMYLWSKGISVSLSAISDFDPEKLGETDFLISGCWTCGWFVVGQHPHRCWREHSANLVGKVADHRILFFTTYKIRTGLLFARMKRAMHIAGKVKVPCLKSKKGFLTDDDRKKLDRFVGLT